MNVPSYSQSLRIGHNPDEVFKGQVDASPHLSKLQAYLASQYSIKGEVKNGALEAELNGIPFSTSFHPQNNSREARINIRSVSPDVANRVKNLLKSYRPY